MEQLHQILFARGEEYKGASCIKNPVETDVLRPGLLFRGDHVKVEKSEEAGDDKTIVLLSSASDIILDMVPGVTCVSIVFRRDECVCVGVRACTHLSVCFQEMTV